MYIPDDGLGFKGRNVGFCQQLINFIDDKSTDGWTMSNNTNTIINSQPRISLKQYLRTGYNEETRRRVRMYETKLHSRARLHNHHVFCLRCRTERLIPKDLRIRPQQTRNRGSTEMKEWNYQQFGHRHSDSFILRNESERVRMPSNELDDVIG